MVKVKGEVAAGGGERSGWEWARETKGGSNGEGLQGVTGPWGCADFEKGNELPSNEIVLELVLNYPGYLTGKFYLGVTLVSMCWLVFMVACGLHS